MREPSTTTRFWGCASCSCSPVSTPYLGGGIRAREPCGQCRTAPTDRRDATLIPAFIEDLLRVDGPVPFAPRVTTRDVEIAGRMVLKDTTVMLSYSSADRDPTRYPDADEVHLDGKAVHFAFGRGPHRCLGFTPRPARTAARPRGVARPDPRVHVGRRPDTPDPLAHWDDEPVVGTREHHPPREEIQRSARGPSAHVGDDLFRHPLHVVEVGVDVSRRGVGPPRCR